MDFSGSLNLYVSIHRRLRIRKSKSLVFILFSVMIAGSAFVTLFDPDGTTGAVMAAGWGVGITMVVALLFSGVLVSKNEKIMIIIAWLVRIVWSTNQSFGLGIQGDPFFEMGYSLYYGYDTCMHINCPILTNYPPILEKWFHVTGPNRFVVSYMNAFLTMAAVFFVIKSFEILKIEGKLRTLAVAIMALNPFIIVFCADVYREAIYIFCSSISFYFFIKWAVVRKKVVYITAALLLTLPIVYLHTGYLMITIAYFIVALFNLKGLNFNRAIYKIIAIIVGVFAAFFVFGLIGGGISNANYLSKISLSLEENLKSFVTISSLQTNTGSMYLRWMTSITTISQFLIFSVLRVIEFLYSPLPFENYRLQDIASFLIDSTIFITATIFIFWMLHVQNVRRIKIRHAKPGYYLVLICAIFSILFVALPFSWGTIASGTAIRHRQCLLPMVCCIIGICGSFIKDRKLSDNEKKKSGTIYESSVYRV